MDQQIPVSPPLRPTPLALHRRQVVRQVWIPLIASIIVLLALMILTIVGAVRGSPQIEKWGNISAIYVIIPVLFAGLLFLTLFGGAIYGLAKLLKALPEWMLRLRMIFLRVALLTYRGANAVTKPVFAVNEYNAGLRALWRKIKRGI